MSPRFRITRTEWKRLLPAVIAGIFFVLWIYNIIKMYAGRPFNSDELYQIEMTKGPLKAFWGHHYYGDHTSFPGDYLLTYPFVRIFGADKWGLALARAPFIFVFYFFLFRLGKFYFHTLAGYAVTFLLVFHHQYFVYHALEFRPYAVLPALAVGSLYFARLAADRFDGFSKVKRVLIGLFFIMVVNYHAYGILLCLLPLLFVILTTRGEENKSVLQQPWVAYYAKYLTAALGIWIWYASGNSFGWSANKMQAVRPAFQFVPHPLEDFYKFSEVIVRNCVGYKMFNFTLLAVPAALLVAAGQRIKLLLFFVILIILPVALVILVDVKTRYWFLARQIVWVMPFVVLFIGWSWDLCWRSIYSRVNHLWNHD